MSDNIKDDFIVITSKDNSSNDSEAVEAIIDEDPLLVIDNLKKRTLKIIDNQLSFMEQNPNLVELRDVALISKITIELENSYRNNSSSSSLDDFLAQYDIDTQYEEIQGYLPNMQPDTIQTEIVTGTPNDDSSI